MASAGPQASQCTSLQTDNHANTSSFKFLPAECSSCRPTNSVKTLKASHIIITYRYYKWIYLTCKMFTALKNQTTLTEKHTWNTLQGVTSYQQWQRCMHPVHGLTWMYNLQQQFYTVSYDNVWYYWTYDMQTIYTVIHNRLQRQVDTFETWFACEISVTFKHSWTKVHPACHLN